MTEKTFQWYYANGNEKVGPISSADLKQLAADGTLLPTDNVWRSDWSEWRTASSVKGLCPQTTNSKSGPPPLQPPRSPINSDSIRLATETVENVSNKLWFLDLRFEQFATPRLIGFVFVASLLLLGLIGVGAIGYGLWTLPALQALIVGIVVVIELVILAICLRVFLECCLIAFKIADHLSHLRHLEGFTSAMSDLTANRQD
jgi:hypothetical protein